MCTLAEFQGTEWIYLNRTRSTHSRLESEVQTRSIYMRTLAEFQGTELIYLNRTRGPIRSHSSKVQKLSIYRCTLAECQGTNSTYSNRTRSSHSRPESVGTETIYLHVLTCRMPRYRIDLFKAQSKPLFEDRVRRYRNHLVTCAH